MSITTNYACAVIFTKHTNLMPLFESRYHNVPDSYVTSVGFNQLKNHYSTPRDVQLILLVRHEPGHTYCKIKCPINPLPIKGEFEVVSMRQITKLLEREGWTFKQTLPISFLK